MSSAIFLIGAHFEDNTEVNIEGSESNFYNLFWLRAQKKKYFGDVWKKPLGWGF